MNRASKYYRKRVIVFGFEGKNNKTETNYFSHFKPVDDRYILKCISCGVTDPVNMINSIKKKRKDLDYNYREDLTFIFVDEDCDKAKKETIDSLQAKLPKDIAIIRSKPCFELWFLNHFCETTKEYMSNDELIIDLKKFIVDYDKNKDYFEILKNHKDTAIKNSILQKDNKNCHTSTDVVKIVDKVIKYK